MRWRTQDDRPENLTLALIAVPSLIVAHDPYIKAEVHRYDATEDRWYSVSGVLQLKNPRFLWLPIAEVLATLPPNPK